MLTKVLNQYPVYSNYFFFLNEKYLFVKIYINVIVTFLNS